MRSAGREHTVLDVREARELAICRLEGALHIPMAEIPARTDVLPTNQPLVVICHHGARSQMVVDFLRNAGFDNAINLNCRFTLIAETGRVRHFKALPQTRLFSRHPNWDRRPIFVHLKWD